MDSIEYKKGMMMLPPPRPVDAVVNTVNCIGIMGKGLAKEFKSKYPDNFHAYAAACKKHEVKTGKMFVHENKGDDALFSAGNAARYIINFPTKRHWKNPSRLPDIEAGLEDLKHCIKQYDIKSIILPALGCGLGGLRWDEVKPRIETALQPLAADGIHIIVYEP